MCIVEGCERVSFLCRKGVGEGITIDKDGEGESSAGELGDKCEVVRLGAGGETSDFGTGEAAKEYFVIR